MKRRRRRKRSAWAAIGRAVASTAASIADAARSVPHSIGVNRLRRAFGGRKPPRIREKSCPESVCGVGGWAGKYHPEKQEATAHMEKRMPRKLRKALRAHETAHHYVCDRSKKSGVRKCTYKGEHDRRFYRTAAKVHRALGTDPEAALELERRSGYKPPRSFARALRSGTSRRRRAR